MSDAGTVELCAKLKGLRKKLIGTQSQWVPEKDVEAYHALLGSSPLSKYQIRRSELKSRATSTVNFPVEHAATAYKTACDKKLLLDRIGSAITAAGCDALDLARYSI